MIRPKRSVLIALALTATSLSLGSSQQVHGAVWITNSQMLFPRGLHTATLLPNGAVLVSGGSFDPNFDLALSNTEIYLPFSRTWTNTGSLNVARSAHTATLLPDGKVLVAGGAKSDGSPLASAEIYNPFSGTWTNTGSLHTARYSHTATLLPNGQVLVVAGYGPIPLPTYHGGPLSSAELYDPTSGEWSETGSLTNARYYHTATLLPNGQVLVAAGAIQSYASISAEVYDPFLGTWSQTGDMTHARDFHTSLLLPNGKVLVVGGNDGGFFHSVINPELYDPISSTWNDGSPLITARGAHTMTMLPDQTVLITGGHNRDVQGVPLASAERYNGGWVQDGSLNAGRYFHTATLLLNGQVLVAGGFDGNNFAMRGTELRVEPVPIILTNATALPGGAIRFSFTNTPELSFDVLTTTNLSVSTSNWTVLGGVTEISPGQFEFTDSNATNIAQRFYRVRLK